VTDTGHRAGCVALLGRPNVGKSTLLNALIGQKVSIVTPKPQTTRHRIAGILTRPGWQAVLLDTPGLNLRQTRGLNRAMNRAVRGALAEADVLCMIADATRWTGEDEAVLAEVRRAGKPALLALNKVDRVRPRQRLLPEQVTDRSERFIAAEAIREKLTLALREELPYGLAVEIERWVEEQDGRLTLGAVIWV
jgi:GTP-binding protein Era